MNVLHVLDHSLPVGSGYSIRASNIVRFQRHLGIRPIVLTSPKHGSPRDAVEVEDGIPHYRTRPVGGPPFAHEISLMRHLARRIREVVRREAIDLIHAHSPLLNGLPALWVGRRLGIPVVYEARAFWEDAAVDNGGYRLGSIRYRLVRALETFLFRHVDAGVTICEGMRRDLIARGIPAARLHVVPNGVDTGWFTPEPRDAGEAARLGIGGGPVFGFIGSFYQYEGLEFLLDAAPELVRRLPGARVLLVGSGPQEAELRTRARTLGDAVVMPGRIPHDRIRRVYAALDVFVCPRRPSRLTELVTPLKPLEAMAMERLVLGSDVGGLAELIEPEVTGLLFEARSAAAFLEQAVRAGRDPGLRRRLGTNARAALAEGRSWHRVVTRYVDVYAAA